jgi:hypothetical protein
VAKVSEEPRSAEPIGGSEIEEWVESLDDVLRRHGCEEAA